MQMGPLFWIQNESCAQLLSTVTKPMGIQVIEHGGIAPTNTKSTCKMLKYFKTSRIKDLI